MGSTGWALTGWLGMALALAVAATAARRTAAYCILKDWIGKNGFGLTLSSECLFVFGLD